MKTQNGSLSRLQPVLEQWTVLGPGERDNWAFQRENFYSTHRKVWSPCCRCTDTFSLSCSSPRKTNKWNKAGQTKLNCSQILIKHQRKVIIITNNSPGIFSHWRYPAAAQDHSLRLKKRELEISSDRYRDWQRPVFSIVRRLDTGILLDNGMQLIRNGMWMFGPQNKC